MLTPVTTHTHELDQPGRLAEVIQIAAEASSLIYEACELSMVSRPA
jgi:hypothetical protein